VNDSRDIFGFGSVAFGIAAIVTIVIVLVAYNRPSTEVTAILSVIVSPIAAIVAAYFGISAVAKGQRDLADKAIKAAAGLDPSSDAARAILQPTVTKQKD
jgi:hypothetical protein